MDLRHLSQKNAYFNAHVSRALWEDYSALFASEAEALKALRVALGAALLKTIADAEDYHRRSRAAYERAEPPSPPRE